MVRVIHSHHESPKAMWFSLLSFSMFLAHLSRDRLGWGLRIFYPCKIKSSIPKVYAMLPGSLINYKNKIFVQIKSKEFKTFKYLKGIFDTFKYSIFQNSTTSPMLGLP